MISRVLRWVGLGGMGVIASGLVACAVPSAVTRTEHCMICPAMNDQEVLEALRRAEHAYREGHYEVALIESDRVIAGAASPEEYADALKLNGLAGCRLRRSLPTPEIASRLMAPEREALESLCRDHRPLNMM